MNKYYYWWDINVHYLSVFSIQWQWILIRPKKHSAKQATTQKKRPESWTYRSKDVDRHWWRALFFKHDTNVRLNRKLCRPLKTESLDKAEQSLSCIVRMFGCYVSDKGMRYSERSETERTFIVRIEARRYNYNIWYYNFTLNVSGLEYN